MTLKDFERRDQVVRLLLTKSESQLESFFFSLGLAPEFQAPSPGWGRQKRIIAALSAAEQRGDLEAVIRLIEERFSGNRTSTDAPDIAVELSGRDKHALATESLNADQEPGEAYKERIISDSVTRVFVVHGHDDLRREQVARLMDRVGSGKLEAVVLAEQADKGMTIIEKFEHHASSAGFAVVLFTKDDLGGSRLDEKLRARARQNVVFELGYFVGVLGRNRTVLLVDDEVEIPSDIYGVLYVKLDESGAWKHQLVREMEAAGLTVDFSRIV